MEKAQVEVDAMDIKRTRVESQEMETTN